MRNSSNSRWFVIPGTGTGCGGVRRGPHGRHASAVGDRTRCVFAWVARKHPPSCGGDTGRGCPGEVAHHLRARTIGAAVHGWAIALFPTVPVLTAARRAVRDAPGDQKVPRRPVTAVRHRPHARVHSCPADGWAGPATDRRGPPRLRPAAGPIRRNARKLRQSYDILKSQSFPQDSPWNALKHEDAPCLPFIQVTGRLGGVPQRGIEPPTPALGEPCSIH